MRKATNLDSGMSDRHRRHQTGPGRRRTAQASRSLFFDRAIHFSQVLAKGVIRIGGAFREIVGKMQLTPERIAPLDLFGLRPLSLPDDACGCEQILHGRHRNKNAAVIIRENYVVRFHPEIAEARGSERRLISRIEPLRSGGPRTVAKNRKPDLP